MRQASLFLMAYVGVPCLYYGTEVGLEGENDPDNRRTFPWERIETSKWLPYFKQMLEIRHQHKSLQSGDILFLDVEEQLVFARSLGEEKLITVLNTKADSAEIRIPVWQLGIESVEATSVLTDSSFKIENGELVAELEGKGSELIKL